MINLKVKVTDVTDESIARLKDHSKRKIKEYVQKQVAKNKAFGIDAGYFIEESLIDTLGFTPVKDSLYGASTRYKTMMNVPIEGVDAKFELKAGKIVKNDATYSVFEAKVAKKTILGDLDKDLLAQEEQVQSVDGVNGPDLKVGSMEDVNTAGNWSKIYDAAKIK